MALAGSLLALSIPVVVQAAEPPVPVVPAIKPIPVKVIVIANFEPGADKGDAPGEFQLWAEREKLDEVIPLKGRFIRCDAMPKGFTAWSGAARTRCWAVSPNS
jgi:purine nucleoside permease